MLFSRAPRQRPDFEKFPATQLFILGEWRQQQSNRASVANREPLALIRVSEPIALTSIFPYAWKLVLHFNIGDRSNASFYAGILISAFSLAEAITGMYWGAYSDRIGRKPVLLMGCAGTVLSLIIVGLSPNFWVALLGRALGGFLNGNIGVIQTMVGELTVNPKHEPTAYAIMPFVWSIGTIAGPAVGGYFAAPTETFPNIFSRDGIFGQFPYLLPNLICAGLMVISIIAGYVLLHETHPDMQPWSTPADLANTHAETPLIPAQAGTTTAAANLAQESSYGTFNRVDAEEIEEWQVKADGRPSSLRSNSEEKVFTRPVVMLIVALGIFTYHSMTYDHLLPIFLQDRRVGDVYIASRGALGGGLGISTQQVGIIMSINGLIALFVQAVVFPAAASLLGVRRVFVLVTLLHPIAYFIVPYLALLPDRLVYPGIYACLATRNLLSILAYPLLLILIKEAAPSHSCLGKINGLAASTGAGCRTMASPIAGYLYGVGVQMDFTAIAWFASAAVAVVGAAQMALLSRPGRNSETHHISSMAPCRLAGERTKDQRVVHVQVREVESDDENERTGLLSA